MSQDQKQLYLPDFCTARAVLAIVIICELTALVLALARNEIVLGFWTDLARTSMFLLWIGLFGAGMLCAVRGYPCAAFMAECILPRFLNRTSVRMRPIVISSSITTGAVFIFIWATVGAPKTFPT